MAFGGNKNNPNNSAVVGEPPEDGVTKLCWSPQANFLIASSWDNSVRCWEVNDNGESAGRAMIQLESPALDACWTSDGTMVFSACCDGKAYGWDLNADKHQPVGVHQAPVRTVCWVDEVNLIATGSWDRFVRYWDGRAEQPAAEIEMPERVLCMDVRYPMAVCGTSDKKYTVFDLRKPTEPYKHANSPLKNQLRCVAAFPDMTGFILGSIEGRCAVQHVEDNMQSKNFTFKCHRQDNYVYPVNAISFHPYGTFVTCGSDGGVNFWDKQSKQRLANFAPCPVSVSAVAFNTPGNIVAYAMTYDWHKGASGYDAKIANAIYLHGVGDEQTKPRPKAATGGFGRR